MIRGGIGGRKSGTPQSTPPRDASLASSDPVAFWGLFAVEWCGGQAIPSGYHATADTHGELGALTGYWTLVDAPTHLLLVGPGKGRKALDAAIKAKSVSLGQGDTTIGVISWR